MTASITTTKTKVLTSSKSDLAWQTILYNCDCHTFEVVINQIIMAIKCPYTTASQLAHVADQLGSVTVYKGSNAQCEAVAAVLGSVGLDVQVSQ